MSLTSYLFRNNAFEFATDFKQYKKLPSGVYNVTVDMQGRIYLTPENIQTETLIQLQDSVMADIYKNVDNFLTPKIKEGFDRYGLVYKRGFLLYGPPGTGKTSLLNQVINLCVEQKDIIVLRNPRPDLVNMVVQSVNTIEETKRTFMIIWEEFEGTVHKHEAYLLNLLDGLTQVQNVVYFATTNYIDKIPSRIRNRPSRFADVIEIGFPNRESRKTFLEAKLHKTDKIDVELWADLTEGLTLDHLKDLIISVCVIGLSFDVALTKVKKLKTEDLMSARQRLRARRYGNSADESNDEDNLQAEVEIPVSDLLE